MPRLRFRKKPRSGNKVEMWDRVHLIKTYLGIPLIHRLTNPPIRHFFNVGWYIPAFLAARLPYRYTTDMAIAPPPYTARFRVPKYDEFQLGMGYTFARSAKASLYLVYGIGALITLSSIIFTIVTGSDFWVILITMLVSAIVLWLVNIRRLSEVHVMTASNLTGYTGTWVNTDNQSVEASEIGAVTANIPSPKWFWNMFRVMDITVNVDRDGDGKEPLILKKIDYGEDVRDLIIALREHLEESVVEGADAAVRTANAVEQLNRNLDKLGRKITLGLRGQRDSNDKLIELLTRLVEQLAPEMEVLDADEEPPPTTKEMPIINPHPDQ